LRDIFSVAPSALLFAVGFPFPSIVVCVIAPVFLNPPGIL